MIIKDSLEKEFQRLRKINNLLNQEIDQYGNINIKIQLEEMIQKNTLAMCEIAKIIGE